MGLLTSSFICDYVVQITAGYCANYRDDAVFRCYMYWRKTSARMGTFFSLCQLRLRQIMIIVAYWIIKASVKLAATIADVTQALTVQWYQYFQNICTMKITSMYQSSRGIRRILEIDGTVVKERKFNRGTSVKKGWASRTSLIVLRRSLVYMICHLKRYTFSV